jgi:hypothetical protein
VLAMNTHAHSRTADELLREYGIHLEDTSIGRHYTTCSRCSANRKTANRRLKCLGVTIEADKVYGGCNNCGWTFPEKKANGHDHSAGSNVLRRHTYYRDGAPAKAKVKKQDGKWYSLFYVDGNWQPRKPDGYVDVPYFQQDLNPFDQDVAGDFLYWPEGEKDTDAIAKMNLLAFTFGGVGDGLTTAVRERLPQYIEGRDVVILADDDEPGRKHARDKAAFAHGKAKSVRIVKFDGFKDVSDWAGTKKNQDVLAGFLENLADEAPLFVPDAIEQGSEGLKGAPGPSKQGNGPRLNWRSSGISVKEIRNMTFNPVSFLVPGIIPAEGATLFCSKPKKGKSWLLLDLALASAMGRYTLGDVSKKPTPGDVLYLALEDNYRRIQQRCDKLLDGPFSAEWPEGLRINLEWRRLDQGGADDIREWVSETRAKGRNVAFVGIDVFQMVRQPGDSKKPYESDYASMSAISALARVLKIAIIVVHHVRKAPSEDPMDLVSGTMGLAGAADTLLVIGRGASGGNVLHVRGRDVEEAELAIEFNKNTCKWTILGKASEVAQNDTRGKILAALRDCAPEAKTPSELTKLTGLKENTLSVSLMRMAKANEIRRPERGKYALAD